jgi:two-component system phosphate regulon sensor histidine kinase PhoR
LGAVDTLSADFGGMLVDVAVRPDAADRLIIGGLPQSRLPLLVALLMLTLGVGTIALILLRREQEFQRLRDDWVSGVSHELRTPLAQIRMFAELQEAGKLAPGEEQDRAVSVIARESRRLTHLVENILQFSRLRRGPERTAAARVRELAASLAEGLDVVNPLVAARGMSIELDVERGVPVSVHRDALTRIIVNLVDNAAKYGPEGQTITLRVQRRNRSALLSVSDEGPGVPTSERNRIWEPYRRLERDQDGREPGTGIGLTVVAKLAAQQGGRVWVESAEGGGARFVVEFPLATAEPEARPLVLDEAPQP